MEIKEHLLDPVRHRHYFTHGRNNRRASSLIPVRSLIEGLPAANFHHARFCQYTFIRLKEAHCLTWTGYLTTAHDWK